MRTKISQIITSPPSQENSDQARRGKSFMEFSRIHPFADVTGHGQISNFEIPAIENFDYVCASPQFYPPIRGGISVSGRIYIQIYIYISEERIQRAQILNYFARYDQRCPTRKKNKRVPMMVSRG